MSRKIAGIPESELTEWMNSSVKEGKNILGYGYQGHTYSYDGHGRYLVIKSATGRGVAKLVRRWMLRHEYHVYRRLSGIEGIPACHGFIQKQFLVLEHVDGIPVRNAPIVDRKHFFESMLLLIQRVHTAGVAHGDLKKKDNILVADGRFPYLIDFGVAVVRKERFAPLNRYLYNLFKKFDYNAWAKLKYTGIEDTMDKEDLQYVHRTVVERTAGWIKHAYGRSKRIFTRR